MGRAAQLTKKDIVSMWLKGYIQELTESRVSNSEIHVLPVGVDWKLVYNFMSNEVCIRHNLKKENVPSF